MYKNFIMQLFYRSGSQNAALQLKHFPLHKFVVVFNRFFVIGNRHSSFVWLDDNEN